jgi:hypothetical protein
VLIKYEVGMCTWSNKYSALTGKLIHHGRFRISAAYQLILTDFEIKLSHGLADALVS